MSRGRRICIVAGCGKTRPAWNDVCNGCAIIQRQRIQQERRAASVKKAQDLVARRRPLTQEDLAAISAKMVFWAKQVGWLPIMDGSILCVDCGKMAECWEHRDYSRPLDVDPVCRGCNKRRGPATSRMKWEPNGARRAKEAR